MKITMNNTKINGISCNGELDTIVKINRTNWYVIDNPKIQIKTIVCDICYTKDNKQKQFKITAPIPKTKEAHLKNKGRLSSFIKKEISCISRLMHDFKIKGH